MTVEVNGGEYAAFQATSGQTYSVSVLDLPTGTGSIVITATTEVSSSPVTVTRTWTYSKTAPTFPDAGSVAQLTQQGNTIWAKTIAEAVRTPGIWGGNLGLALSKLANAVLYDPETGGFNGIGGADATIPMVSIETGSYVGTGTSGASNPTIITLANHADILFVSPQVFYNGGSSITAWPACFIRGVSYASTILDGTGGVVNATVTWDGNKVSFYNQTSAIAQLNRNGARYNYVAVSLAGGVT